MKNVFIIVWEIDNLWLISGGRRDDGQRFCHEAITTEPEVTEYIHSWETVHHYFSREPTTDWYAQRGMTWHITHYIMKRNGEYYRHATVHFIKNEIQVIIN